MPGREVETLHWSALLTCISLKSCSCMAVEKSSSMWVRLGHLLLSSCSTVWVMSSMGSSMYRSDGPNRMLCQQEASVSYEPWPLSAL